jgi:P4 family phage/plasmid primase-like protien
MDLEIKKILENRLTDGVFHTHVSMISPYGKFLFDPNSSRDFWQRYCEVVETTDNPLLGIAEKPTYYIPVLADIDLKVKEAEYEEENLYTQEDLLNVISIYQSVIREIVEDCCEEDLTCCVLEKDPYKETKNGVTYLKNGFHLHFPFCFLNRVDQEIHLIPRVKSLLEKSVTFSNLPLNIENVIDKQTCVNAWLMYKSKKSEKAKPYLLTQIFDSNLVRINLKKAFKHYQLFDENENLIDITDKIKFYLPRILSIIPALRRTREIKKGIISPIKERIKKDKKLSSITNDRSVEDLLKEAEILLEMISDLRASDNNDWMEIGWTLYNISLGSSEGLDLWCQFSSRCEEKYDENDCVNKWNKMTFGGLTIGTLKHFAKIDNPGEYKKLKSEKSKKYITSSLEGSHNDIAKLLYEQYGDEFRCGSISNKTWFQFRNHKWEEIEEGVYLSKKISDEITVKYLDLIRELTNQYQQSQDKTEQTLITARIKQANKMLANLKNSNYKKSIMKECAEVFYDPRFIEKLDCDPYLIAFKNGVYDLKLNNFRGGRPEDFLSKSMPINYIEFSEEEERVQEVYTFLEKVFPDKSLREYFLSTTSDIFLGGNHAKIALIWSGEGDNGKTVTQQLLEAVFGKLAINLDTSIITGKKAMSGTACPELARSGGGVRLIILEEPDGDEIIRNGTFKKFTGNGRYYARDLFEKGKSGREINPLYKIILICNDLPAIKDADKATWNRVRVLPFESTFVDEKDAPLTYEEQLKQKRFIKDGHFGKKLQNLAEPFAWILLKYRQKNQEVKSDPEKVLLAIDRYKKRNDYYHQYITESIIADKESKISLIELYASFKEWFKQSMPGMQLPKKLDTEEYFKKLWGNPLEGKKWNGYRIRNIQDDIRDGNPIKLTENDLVDPNIEDLN